MPDPEEGIQVLATRWHTTPGVTNEGDQSVLMPEFHESPWFGLPGTWATFEKVKERYRWLGMYKDVHHFVSTCESYQMYSAI